jgi:hypothetical protein
MYGITDPRLKEDPLPFYCISLWNMFWALHATRNVTYGGMYQPISYAEIESYSRLLQIAIEPWEIEIIKRMDRAFINSINTKVGDK